ADGVVDADAGDVVLAVGELAVGRLALGEDGADLLHAAAECGEARAGGGGLRVAGDAAVQLFRLGAEVDPLAVGGGLHRDGEAGDQGRAAAEGDDLVVLREQVADDGGLGLAPGGLAAGLPDLGDGLAAEPPAGLGV